MKRSISGVYNGISKNENNKKIKNEVDYVIYGEINNVVYQEKKHYVDVTVYFGNQTITPLRKDFKFKNDQLLKMRHHFDSIKNLWYSGYSNDEMLMFIYEFDNIVKEKVLMDNICTVFLSKLSISDHPLGLENKHCLNLYQNNITKHNNDDIGVLLLRLILCVGIRLSGLLNIFIKIIKRRRDVIAKVIDLLFYIRFFLILSVGLKHAHLHFFDRRLDEITYELLREFSGYFRLDGIKFDKMQTNFINTNSSFITQHNVDFTKINKYFDVEYDKLFKSTQLTENFKTKLHTIMMDNLIFNKKNEVMTRKMLNNIWIPALNHILDIIDGSVQNISNKIFDFETLLSEFCKKDYCLRIKLNPNTIDYNFRTFDININTY